MAIWHCRCNNCGGDGYVRCPRCDGEGELLWYLLLIVEWLMPEYLRAIQAPTCMMCAQCALWDAPGPSDV